MKKRHCCYYFVVIPFGDDYFDEMINFVVGVVVAVVEGSGG